MKPKTIEAREVRVGDLLWDFGSNSDNKWMEVAAVIPSARPGHVVLRLKNSVTIVMHGHDGVDVNRTKGE